VTVQPPSAGVIGWPVAHSKSPLIHRFWLAKLGIDGDYGRFPVAPERLGAAIGALAALGLRGVNVTVPHKVAVMGLLDALDPAAARVGAVNTVVVENQRLVGYNTDVDGVGEALTGVVFGGASIVIVGAGGAARAAVAALSGSECEELLVVARDPTRAVELTRPFDVFGVGVPFEGLGSVVATADVIINASPLGMEGQPGFDDDVTAALRRSSACVFDMVYVPLETPLLAAARARGLRTIDGLAMLIGQAAAAFALFYGAAAPREFDAELRALLTAKPL
jgi:shikimate dehydrogenase